MPNFIKNIGETSSSRAFLIHIENPAIAQVFEVPSFKTRDKGLIRVEHQWIYPGGAAHFIIAAQGGDGFSQINSAVAQFPSPPAPNDSYADVGFQNLDSNGTPMGLHWALGINGLSFAEKASIPYRVESPGIISLAAWGVNGAFTSILTFFYKD